MIFRRGDEHRFLPVGKLVTDSINTCHSQRLPFIMVRLSGAAA
jgi:hypothetical protein